MNNYLDAVRDLIARVSGTQQPAIAQAASLIAEALLNGRALFCHEIGHGLQGDFVRRAGGLAAVRPFSFKLDVQDDVAPPLRERPRPAPVDRVCESVRLAVRVSQLRGGDVMMLGSVSGRNIVPVELARACREMGVHTIGFTSKTYTARVASLHPSGQRLAEVVDVVIDNGAPYGDAAVKLPGYESEVLPLSGLGTLQAGWTIFEEVLRRMHAAGSPATVFQSVNREGGEERLRATEELYARKGY
ncbi:MAG: sugar isomerase domain-containing protein [Kiritimatiellae bacterium]|nr:sugar isomerase domain-containing protein [Kiritimatiellia bacterium]